MGNAAKELDECKSHHSGNFGMKPDRKVTLVKLREEIAPAKLREEVAPIELREEVTSVKLCKEVTSIQLLLSTFIGFEYLSNFMCTCDEMLDILF